MQKNETGPLPYIMHKVNLKWIKDLNLRPGTIKHLEENIGGKFFDVSLRDFLIFKNFLILFFNIFIGV